MTTEVIDVVDARCGHRVGEERREITLLADVRGPLRLQALPWLPSQGRQLVERTSVRREGDMREPTIVGEATQVVRATPEEVMSFVLDLERYRQADHKIGRVGKVERTGNSGFVQFSGRVRGLPGPSGTYPFTIADTRLVFGSPVAGLARWMLEFEGSFECQRVDGGTKVTHREEFRFKHPWRLLARLLLGRWLATDTAREMVRLKGLLEVGPGSAPSPT